MPASEFDLIRRYLAEATAPRADVALGIGDDCALLQPAEGEQLAVTIDTLVEGRHFVAGADPLALGHKALAVNLSDLAAMGARPAWATLALTMPSSDEQWLGEFVAGFAALAARHDVQLVGGDTTRGPLTISVQVHGFVAADAALRRSAGRAGDRLFVSGTLGDASLALARARSKAPIDDFLHARLDRPTPRIELGRLLAGRARAAIDISDGLVADLGHICEASGVGAQVELARLPLSASVAAVCETGDWSLPLAGGDDYELLFSVAPDRADVLYRDCSDAGFAIQEIGRLTDQAGIVLVYPDGHASTEIPDGFDHFRS